MENVAFAKDGLKRSRQPMWSTTDLRELYNRMKTHRG